MAKRGGFPGGMPGSMTNLMKQAQRMQRQMEEGKKELETKLRVLSRSPSIRLRRWVLKHTSRGIGRGRGGI